MKNILTITALLLLLAVTGKTQTLTQTIRGNVIDTDSQLPLIGAEIQILDAEIEAIGTVTDFNGNFKIEDVTVGRLTVQVSYLGYESKTFPNIVVNSGKETVLQISLEESAIMMQDVVITAQKSKGEAINDMALISARSISAEETNRYAGGFNDPSRIMSNFAGVTTSHDGGNDIIVRGNSPKYVQWQLDGIPITNPNHFGDQSGVGGAVSTLNNNMLASSDFFSGAFSPEYGNVLSGVYDVKLRSGNNEKVECVFGFGLLGTDITLEGPLSKKNGGSFIVNYRYSTASLLDNFGLLDEINGVPTFQDASFKLLMPTKKLGVFSFFGLAGKSDFRFEDVTPGIWVTPGNIAPQQREDFEKTAHLLNLGLNHTYSLGQNSYIKSSLSYSNEKMEDDVFVNNVLAEFDEQGAFLRDSILSSYKSYQSDVLRNNYRAAISLNHKFNAKHKIQFGSKYFVSGLDNSQILSEDNGTSVNPVDFNENLGILRNYVSWKYKPSEQLTIVSGLQNVNVLFNKKATIEPRVALNYKLNHHSSIHLGVGQHSMVESVHHYFTEKEDGNGNTVRLNEDLDVLKARHYVLGYEQRLGRNFRAKAEVYYQDLYNLPVENNAESHFSTINEGLDFTFVDLVNEGRGKNYGIELTLEKFYANNFYYLLNGTLYQSKYTALDGVERNSKYNGNYLVNILAGREFENLGKKKNQSLNVNAKIFFGGGKGVTPLLRNSEGQAIVDPRTGEALDYAKPFEKKIEDIYLVVLSAGYKWNKSKSTHELFLNIDNVTNTKGRISEFYDEREQDNTGYVTQFGIFPNLMYRVYF